jgi:hypothetical protein
MEQAITRLLADHPNGLTNSEIARELNLQSDFAGRQKNYLTYSVLGGLMKKGVVKRGKIGARQPFKLSA